MATMIYYTKEGNKITGKGVKELYDIVSEDPTITKIKAEQLIEKHQREVDSVLQIIEEQRRQIGLVGSNAFQIAPFSPFNEFQKSNKSTILSRASQSAKNSQEFLWQSLGKPRKL